ncbi:MAG: hypothetical protein DIZ80_16665 [endosymbiont of Galathealinum brachiosum]|uniref:Uncharacterized protein n=1 Tax=endosymbiont of Galathealinum brachiosum TaxID=2200906 RepID=A0A370D6K3_9GAMM|nr:MAG: hypothetical protein DIZ80_16665 [endosymbiont of Galathealinum brachiosum]
MDKQKLARKIVTLSAGGATLWACIQIILFVGVEKKSFIQMFADIIGGGTIGATIGILFFIVFGAIGWVSGALYGALGVLSLMLGGALGGLGLGSLIHIARNPNHYSFNVPVILVGALITYMIYKWVTSKMDKLYDEHGPSLINWFMKKLEK